MTKNQSVARDAPLGFSVAGIIAKAGGCGAVAKRCGITVQAVASWTRRIPGEHAQTVAIMAGLPLEIVRPDLVQSGHEQAVRYAKAI